MSTKNTWTTPEPLALNGSPIKTKYTPGIINFSSKLFCLWVEDESNTLVYSILAPNNGLAPSGNSAPTPTFWNQRSWTAKQSVGPEQLSGPPALAALNGTVHVVLADRNKNLVHYQYTDSVGWGRRCGLVAQSNEPASLATFRNQLHCVYKDATSNKLSIVRWGPELGWTVPLNVGVENVPETRGQMALFELKGQLQLMATKITDGTGPTGEIIGFTSNNGTTWIAMPINVLGPGMVSSFGVNASCFNGNAFMVYSNENNVWAKHFATEKWQANERQKDTKTSATPAIAVLDNDVVCVWPDDNGMLSSMTRKAWNIPSLHDWTSHIGDQYFITDLTIPGTHDAVSCTDFIFARTQNTSITEQLWQGIRYFDLRGSFLEFAHIYYELNDPQFGSIDDPAVYVFHNNVAIYRTITNAQGAISKIPMSMESVFGEFYDFLRKNKKETIIVQIKQDAGSKDPTAAANFADRIKILIDKHPEIWSITDTVPTMGDLRGRIQLVRRYPLNRNMPYGISLNDPVWNGSAVVTIPAFGAPRARIQDVWNFIGSTLPSTITTKFNAVETHLDAAMADPNKQILYLNFCSANGLPMAGPQRVALGGIEGVNQRLNSYFNDVTTPGRYGVILMDFIEQPAELITGLIKTNADKFKKV